MRINKWLRVYQQMCPEDSDLEPGRCAAITQEMKAVAAAPTATDARKIVAWWPWSSQQEMDSWIRRARKLMAEKSPTTAKVNRDVLMVSPLPYHGPSKRKRKTSLRR